MTSRLAVPVASLLLFACGSDPPAKPGGGGAPTATASATPTSGATPLDVQFQCDASGGTAPLAFTWDFGDGTESTLPNPGHTYTSAGTFTAMCQVTDAAGESATSSVTISATGASANGPMAVAEVLNTTKPGCAVTGQTLVQLSGASSTDADGDTLWYEWAMISVPQGSTAALSNPIGPMPTFAPDVDGTYVVRLHVSDPNGLADNKDLTIKSESAGQVVTISGDAQMAADASALSPVVVAVETPCGLPVTGKQVDFAITAGQGTVSPSYGVSDSTGQITTNVTLGCQLGAGTLQAQLTGTAIVDDLSFTALLGPAAQVVLSKPLNTPVPGPMVVHAEVHDACGNLVNTDNTTAFTISVTEATADASAYFSGITTGTAIDTTNPESWIVRVANGIVELTLADAQAETITFLTTDSQATGLQFVGGGGTNYDQTQSSVAIACNGGTITVSFAGAPPPNGAGTLTIGALIDSDTSDEQLLVYAESLAGDHLASLYGNGVPDCSFQSASVPISQTALAGYASDGTITFALQTTSTIDCFCADTIDVELSYPSNTTADFTP